jgi:hypothetical protein
LQCFDVELEVVFQNRNNHAVTISEVGCFRLHSVGGNLEMLMSFRETFPAETIESFGGAVFTITLRTFCQHFPMRMVNIIYNDDHVELLTPSGMRFVGEPAEIRVRRKQVQGGNITYENPPIISVPPVVFSGGLPVDNERRFTFIMPNAKLNVGILSQFIPTDDGIDPDPNLYELSVEYNTAHGHVLSPVGWMPAGSEIELHFEPNVNTAPNAKFVWDSPMFSVETVPPNVSLPNVSMATPLSNPCGLIVIFDMPNAGVKITFNTLGWESDDGFDDGSGGGGDIGITIRGRIGGGLMCTGVLGCPIHGNIGCPSGDGGGGINP